MPIVLTPQFSIAARALAEIDQAQLAEQAGLPTSLLADFEAGVHSFDEPALARLTEALEHFGVEFLPENDTGAGLRLKFNRQETGQILNWEGEGGTSGEDDVP
ncbi:hypothetical protein IMCC20628_02542 [Hoeflea sp. IMCC20628]|uniref:helix-turn-helix domain-containing protein n=1 Tax=Hoeflea sp. IMCC20628 TaxID=1620421 RepID=UPI00063BE13B|nr:helix-turn-helix transcriptional regulator [Hoeflea sp. IMCC20628]AKI01240.1 hypothetical protein IMCC20628_02542 [Hoeflea sp. IMCC20628]